MRRLLVGVDELWRLDQLDQCDQWLW